jgi:thiol-disulfide isomerase/thioredoxin
MSKLPALMAMAASAFAVSGSGAQVPRKAPEFVFHMVGAPEQLLSSYKGKTIALALMYTTCVHCQKIAGTLTKVQEEYKAKGVQVLGAVFDDGAASRAVEFHQKFAPDFPVGYSEKRAVLEFLGLPPDDPYFVPILVFIDKRGMIRSQYIGDETFLGQQEKNIRLELDKMLAPAHVAPKPQ